VYFGFRERPQLAIGPDGRPALDQDGLPIAQLAPGRPVKPDYVFTQTEYERDGGKVKVVNCVTGKNAADLLSYLASDFDVIFAIDTNTKNLRGDAVSIAPVVECYARKVDATQVQVLHRKLTNIAFKNCPGVAERFAWWKLLELVRSNPTYTDSVRVGIITDHDLGNHSQYNSGELPIYDSIFLPRNVSLIYASAEVGQEEITNFLVKRCEKDAKDVLGQLEKTGTAIIDGDIAVLDKIPDVRAAGGAGR